MKVMTKVGFAIFSLSLGMSSTIANAATDGTLGLTSTGTSEISISKGDVVQISKVTDVTFGQWITGDGSQEGLGEACVYSTTGAYSIKASSGSGGVAFQLDDGANNKLNYAVTWVDTQDGNNEIGLENNVTTAESLSSSDSSACTATGGTNANFRISIAELDLDSAAVGNYTDTLTLLVVPE